MHQLVTFHQLQSNVKDDYVTIHKSRSFQRSQLSKAFTTDTSGGRPTQRATTAWYKLKSRAFPGLFLETLSRASSAKDLSHKSVSTRQGKQFYVYFGVVERLTLVRQAMCFARPYKL